jgi:hypothetical protein
MSEYYVSHNDPAGVKEVAERFGFCLVKGIFSPDEMASLERDLAMAHAEFPGNVPDIYSIPSLQWLLFDDRIRALAHALLGKQLVYYRETSAAFERVPGPLTMRPFTDYHCDARGSAAELAAPPDFGGIYPAYRFGIYFRNYRNFSGGLKVAPGSHLRDYFFDRRLGFLEKVKELTPVSYRVGRYDVELRHAPMELYNVPSEPGDIVIFSLRCFHSAGAVRLRDRPTLALLPHVEARLPPEHCLPTPPGTRNAIFLDYGAPHPAVDYYIKWRAVTAAELKRPYRYGGATPEWMLLRNDRVIVALAHRLVEDTNSPTEKDAADLIALCQAHVEFAPEHALFDRAAIDANLAAGKSHAAVALARDIVGRVRTQAEIEKQGIAMRRELRKRYAEKSLQPASDAGGV